MAATPTGLLPDESPPQVRLQLLPHGGHVVRPEQVALDQPVEPVPGDVLLGGLGAYDGVGADLDLRPLGGAVVDLGEAGVVGQQPLEAAVGLRTEEARLDGRITDLLAGLVDDPGPAHVVEERSPVVGEDALLAELEGLDRRVVAATVALSGAQQPRDGRAIRVQVVGDLERHDSAVRFEELVDHDERHVPGQHHDQRHERDEHGFHAVESRWSVPRHTAQGGGVRCSRSQWLSSTRLQARVALDQGWQLLVSSLAAKVEAREFSGEVPVLGSPTTRVGTTSDFVGWPKGTCVRGLRLPEGSLGFLGPGLWGPSRVPRMRRADVKDRIQRRLWKRGVHVGAYRWTYPARRQMLWSASGVKHLFDVGANIGQYGKEVRNHGYLGCIHSFEPVSAAYVELEEVASGDPEWDVHRMAVGSTAGTLEINVSQVSTFSSMLPVTQTTLDGFGPAAYVRTETVPTTTLDDVLPEAAQGEGYAVKMDVQGFEQQVIEGGERAIAGAAAVEIELCPVELYEGQWLMLDLLHAMDQRGFTPALIDSIFPQPDGRSLAFNGLFLPRG